MLYLKAMELHKEWNGVPLFSGVSFEVRQGERLAIIGRNGVGKTTLFRGLLGQEAWDGGKLHRMLPLEEWGWLDQQAEPDSSLTVLEYVQSASGERFKLKQQLTSLAEKMGADSRSDAIMARYGELYDKYEQLGGFDWEADVERRLQQVGLEPALWGLRFAELSGGQKTRAGIAAIMVKQPKLLLLDEPTNHLDSQALDWLEEWVRQYPGAVLYVSHDRTFIDRTATAVLELTPDGVRRYTGGYSAYKEQKEIELRTQAALAHKQEQERRKLLESIRRYAQWFQQAHRAAGQNDFYRSKAKKNVSRLHAKESALDRLEASRVQKPKEETKIRMSLDADRHEARHLLRMEGVSFSYEEGSCLLDRLNLTVGRGDRIAVIGPNGAGKSTLLKLAAGRLVPDEGEVRVNPQTRIGYFAQELDDLPEEETILDSLLGLPGMTQTEARTILGCFLFSRDDAFKRIKDLSMGEKCRVAFLRLYFGRGNLLVLDEPTNYLDIPTRERVEEALLNYPGALMLVTHDRYLVRRAANRLLVLERGRAPESFDGTYDEYSAGRAKRGMSAEEQAADNERMELDLRLAQLMSEPEAEDEAGRESRLQEIIALRRRLEGLERLERLDARK